MKIVLENLSKRFNRQWIFKDVNLELASGNSYAVIGPNGSGKSTFVKVLMGVIPPTEGNLLYQVDGKAIEDEDIYKCCSLASPYLELIEEFTLLELLNFHFKFKNIKSGFNVNDILEIAYLEPHKNKPIRHFSSGMKQRLKLALAFYSDSPVLLLDEPTSNLDVKGIEWYNQQISLCTDNLVIVASNQDYEIDFCENKINITDYL